MRLADKKCEISGDGGKISGVIGNYAELIISAKVGHLDVNTSENGKLTLK